MENPELAPVRPLETRKTAIIVGASSGMGAALARRMAREGYKLALLARRMDLLQALCEEINGNDAPSALAYEHDVTDIDSVPALLQKIAADLGGLDMLVYCAGTQDPSDSDRFDAQADIQIMKVNTLGAIAWVSPVAERFMRAGRGQIVGIGSVAGGRGRAGFPAYTASKAGLHNYLEGMRNRLSRHGVTVTTLRMGQVETRLLKNADKPRGPISPALAADLMWKQIAGKAQDVHVPFRWAVIALIVRHIPSFIFRRMNI